MARRKSKLPENQEMDITSFMNLMVILIPFLLLNAVFTQLNVVGVERTGNRASASNAAPPALQLDVYVYNDRFVVDNRGRGTIATINFAVDTPDYKQLNEALHKLKTQHPTVNSAMLRVAENVSYQHLIRAMDATRIVITPKQNTAALFSDLQVASLAGTS